MGLQSLNNLSMRDRPTDDWYANTPAGSIGGAATGGGNTLSGGGGTDYKSMVSKLAQSLMPGGEIEKSYINEANQEGKDLAAQLNAASISKGLGNATNNAPVVAAKHVAKRKQEIRSGMLQQLLQTMQFLTNISFQESEAQKSRELNAAQFNANMSRGSADSSALGTPFMGNYGLGSIGNNYGGGFSANAYPSVAAAGGMSGEQQKMATPVEKVFGKSSNKPPSFAGSRQYGDPYFINGRDVTKPM